MPVAPAANAIVDLATAKIYTKTAAATADDDLIQTIINSVSSLFEKYCASKFINAAITEVIDGLGTDVIFLEYCPIAALTEIQFDFDTTPSIQALINFNYKAAAGIIHTKDGVFTEGYQNIQVKYTAGYGAAIANLPDDLKLAALKQVEYFYKRDSADFSTTFEEGLILKAPSELLSPTVRDMLTPYFRIRL